MRAWLLVFAYSLLIFLTIPFARGIQKFVYATFGKEFFTYAILFIIATALATLLYILFFRLNIRNLSQYIWLSLCAILYAYFTVRLKKHPEEAVHFLEYGLLGYLLFNALSKRIQDKTIYITSVLCVFFIGTLDEFIQWMTPDRFWGFRDIGINTLAGAISMLGVWKGIRPEKINGLIRRSSVNLLLCITTINLLLLGLCLSNTPEAVKYYTDRIGFLSWLTDEEPMIEYGYKYRDPEIGVFYSRLRLNELEDIDLINGKEYGRKIANEFKRGITYEELISSYDKLTNPFMYEFIIHLDRRDKALKDLRQSDNSIKNATMALKENFILERYFGNTLRHSEHTIPDKIIKSLKEKASSNNEVYISRIGRLITVFDLKTAWSVISMTLILLWIIGHLYRKRLHG